MPYPVRRIPNPNRVRGAAGRAHAPRSNLDQPVVTMPQLFESPEQQHLILELLARRQWFEPKKLSEIEEVISKAGPGTLPEVTLIRAGLISEQEVTNLYAEDLFLPAIHSNVEAGEVDKEV